MTAQQMAEACAEVMWQGDHASRGLGMELISVGPGTSIISMIVTSEMSNGHGNCHGGFIFALADSSFAFACNGYNQLTVGHHCSITYLAPARIGDRLTAQAREVSRQGRSGVYDVTVINQNGEHLAEFRGHSRTVKGNHIPDQD